MLMKAKEEKMKKKKEAPVMLKHANRREQLHEVLGEDEEEDRTAKSWQSVRREKKAPWWIYTGSWESEGTLLNSIRALNMCILLFFIFC